MKKNQHKSAGAVDVTLHDMDKPSAHVAGETPGSKVCLPARCPSQTEVRR